MAGVLTHREYKEFSKKSKEESTEEVPGVKEVDIPVKKEPPKVFLYHLLHPDNPMDTPLNFKDELILDGKSYERECINGVIRTEDKPMYEFLLGKGFYLMEKEEI